MDETELREAIWLKRIVGYLEVVLWKADRLCKAGHFPLLVFHF